MPKAPKTPEYNPPKGWAPPTPPTSDNEEQILAEAFGEPENGVYAPQIEVGE